MKPPTRTHALIPIDQVIVGERHRQDMGDIDGLAASIASPVGLLQPIVVTSGNALVAGARRLAAVKKLGWAEIPATVVDLEQIVLGEYAENAFHKQFTPSEIVSITAAVEPLEREQAKARQGARTDQHPENFSRSSGGRALDKVATVAADPNATAVSHGRVIRALTVKRPLVGRRGIQPIRGWRGKVQP